MHFGIEEFWVIKRFFFNLMQNFKSIFHPPRAETTHSQLNKKHISKVIDHLLMKSALFRFVVVVELNLI